MGWFKDFFKTEEEEKEVEKYSVDVFCFNCKTQSTARIIKGNSVKDSLRKISCSNCGLKEIVPYSLNLHFAEGSLPVQIENLIDWINVDEDFKKKYIKKSENENKVSKV